MLSAKWLQRLQTGNKPVKRGDLFVFKRILSALLALGLLLGTAAPALADSGAIQDELDGLNARRGEIQSRMDAIQAEIDSLDQEKTNALEKKLVLDEKNQAAREELDVLQEQIDIVDGMLASIQEDLEKARTKEEYQRRKWLGRVRAMEETSEVGYLDVLFEADSFSDLLTRLDMVGGVMEYDEGLEEAYIAARSDAEALEARAQAMYAQNQASREELEQKKARLDADTVAACELIAGMESNIDQYTEIMAQEAETRAGVDALIIEKEKELKAARAAETAAQSGTVATGSADSGAWMMWPSYTKYLTSPFGPRNHPISGQYKNHDGVDIGASYGSDIWAAAAGTVILAGRNGGYGNCVIVNHGNGYTTVYGHMDSIAVSAGQSVSMGQVLGYVGSTGNSTGPHLHFEIRSSATAYPIDPQSFLYLT